MTIKTLSHLLIVLSLLTGGFCSPCAAQTTAGQTTAGQTTTDSTASDSPANAHSIDERIADQVKALKQLQTLLSDSENLPVLTDLFQRLPVNADNINSKIEALSADNISARQITQSKQLADVIKQQLARHQAYQRDLDSGRQQLKNIRAHLIALQQLLSNPINQAKVTAENQQLLPQLLLTVTKLDEVFGQTIKHEKHVITQAEKAVTLLKNWQDNLALVLSSAKQISRFSSNREIINQQKKEEETEIIKLTTKLQSQLDKLSLTEIEDLQIQIYQKQTHLWLLSVDSDLLQWISEFPNSKTNADNDINDIKNNQNSDTDNILEEQLVAAQLALPLIASKYDEVKARQADLKRYSEVIGEQPKLQAAFKKRLQNLAFQRLQIEQRQQQLKQQLSQRQHTELFARHDMFSSNRLTVAVLRSAFMQVIFQVQISFTSLYRQFISKPWKIILVTFAALLSTFLLMRTFNYWLTSTSLKKGMNIGLIATLRKLAHAIRRRVYVLIILALLVALVRFSNTPFPGNSIIHTLVYTSGGLILWLEMTAIEVKLGSISKKMALRSHLFSIILALLILLYNLSKFSAVAPEVVMLYETVLMAGMAGFTWVVQKNLLSYLKTEQKQINRKAYRVYSAAVKVLPKIVIGLCLLGVIGFANLAWLVLGYIIIIILCLAMFTLGIIILNLLRKKGKLATLKRFKHGAFIAQDIINPLSTLCRGIWILFCLALLFSTLSWYSGSTFLFIKLVLWLEAPLFTFSGNSINLLSLLLLAASPFILFRMAKWLKSFSYHWLFVGISDLGVRNSLAIFSQYVAALVGVLITLKVVGIDLTSLAVFAGALGVGVGLGLQDIAKNFISGILLLIERPLRSGDWVDIDGSEGTIKSIGMRAITLQTFDNQEVIIPNGNAINNSFTNYTHSNSLIRTVLYVGTGYACEPDVVIRLLQNILQDNQDVLKDPKSKVVMWEYADSSINYRIQYYIDMDKSGLWEVKTAVLKAIWHEFKAHNIEIPFPQRDINFRNRLTMQNIIETGSYD